MGESLAAMMATGSGNQFTPTIDEGAKRAFSNDLRPAYHVGAMRDSWVKLRVLLEKRLVA